MKFTIGASYLIVAVATFAVLSTEATSMRRRYSLSHGNPLTEGVQLDAPFTGVHRRLDQSEDGSEDQSEDENEDQSEDNESNDAEEENESNDAEEENEDDAEDGAAQGENDAASDDYVFYDDEAIQDCEDDDEDCVLAATYAAYGEEALANCEDDDEECNEAAAYMTAKKNQEEVEEETQTNPWNVNTYIDKYNSMSRNSKTWTIALAAWFLVLVIVTSYFCCCRKGYQSKQKDLRETLMEDTSKNNGEVA